MIGARLLVLAALVAPQTRPGGGAIARYVPPVPTPASFIADPSGVLSKDAHATLDARLTEIQRAGLGDIAVAILPSIGDYAPNQVSVEIYRTWRVGSVAGIGSAHRNVGVLILIVPKELAPNHRGECWINTGTGAEGILTDATTGTICRDSIIPHLRDRDYAGGLSAGISALEARLRAEPGLADTSTVNAPRRGQSRSRGGAGLIVLYSVLGVIALVGLGIGVRLRRRYRPRKCPQCGRMMRRMSEMQDDAKLEPGQVLEEKLNSVDYDVWACDCGNTLVIPYTKMFSGYTECRKCHRRTVATKRQTLVVPTTSATGTAQETHTCKSCGEIWTTTVVLPRISASSSSSGGGWGGGGAGGSFGGSGSTSGGGGGGSY